MRRFDMPIITIRGQLGSGAPEIGKAVAKMLKIDYVDREIIAEVASRLKWSEEGIAYKEMPPGTLMGRIAEAMARYPIGTGTPGIGYQEVYLPTWEMPLNDSHYLIGLESVIKELAGSKSIVIRGRGSQFILKDFPGSFHVLVIAPLDVRIKRTMDDLKLKEEDAKKEINRFDSSHKEFTKRYFQADLEDSMHYDIVLNTMNISFTIAASIVADAGKKISNL